MIVDINCTDVIREDEVVALYKANEWSSAEKPKALLSALRNSHSLITARIDGRLVGLANAISDGHLVVYYPHMLVDPDFHRCGIGSKIMQAMKKRYKGFHQQMLTADGNAIRFYKSLGFEKAGETSSMWIYEGNEH
ncbi:GNAT family N-acetyltransferase [Neptuniibacter sp. QD48_55]|uniref:GNAT family N-acetyltransferase n=1 Tax=Neptuniibacter sp. QD48_55 TaxID=3398212 RepID=UPI0039F5E471